MGVTTNDMFGTAAHAEPAEPGSYGQAPSRYRLPDGTRLGAVRLQVADLERSLLFYQRTLGFRVVKQTPTSAALAALPDRRVLVELEERSGSRPAVRGRLG